MTSEAAAASAAAAAATEEPPPPLPPPPEPSEWTGLERMGHNFVWDSILVLGCGRRDI